MKKYIGLVSLLLLMCIFTLPVKQVSSATDYSRSALSNDQVKAEQLVNSLPITDVLGPLAPVALSPFFGLTCLSATSILSEKVDFIPDNKFLTGNEALNNPAVFMAFLVLTIATSIPKLTTVTKVFAQAVDQVETYAGIVSYLVVFGLAVSAAGDSGEQVIYTAGIFTFTKHALLMAACVINIFVINTVKFFFELLVLISPIPTLDAMFEAANKAVAAVIAIIYAFNPWLAFVLNLLLFLVCLAIFQWAHKRIRFYRSILLAPAEMTIRKKLFNSSGDPNAGIKDKIAHHIKDGIAIVKVFPEKRFGKIKKRDACCIIKSGDNLLLVKLRLFRKQ